MWNSVITQSLNHEGNVKIDSMQHFVNITESLKSRRSRVGAIKWNSCDIPSSDFPTKEGIEDRDNISNVQYEDIFDMRKILFSIYMHCRCNIKPCTCAAIKCSKFNNLHFSQWSKYLLRINTLGCFYIKETRRDPSDPGPWPPPNILSPKCWPKTHHTVLTMQV